MRVSNVLQSGCLHTGCLKEWNSTSLPVWLYWVELQPLMPVSRKFPVVLCKWPQFVLIFIHYRFLFLTWWIPPMITWVNPTLAAWKNDCEAFLHFWSRHWSSECPESKKKVAIQTRSLKIANANPGRNQSIVHFDILQHCNTELPLRVRLIHAV